VEHSRYIGHRVKPRSEMANRPSGLTFILLFQLSALGTSDQEVNIRLKDYSDGSRNHLLIM